MRKLEKEFTYKGVRFKIIKRGKNALMLNAKSDFYCCPSVEVWQIRIAPPKTINGKHIEGGERKPSNEDYPYSAHQFMQNHFDSELDMVSAALKLFNEYEQGVRPRKTVEQCN